MDKRVFVVSHTHWDREWYLTKSAFQMMNADMMEHLLKILETGTDFSSFMLDGQLIALEDYLDVYPDRKERICSLVKNGRLAIGPWYVLPDEYLASGEAHIRNFLEGMRLADDYGGGMKIGYLPDSFGHPSQMPQIISGLGMQEMIFWRGTGPEVGHTEFTWQGKDGSGILALNMLYGYSNAANLKEDHVQRFKRLDHEINKLLTVSALNLALLMNGSDHIAPDARVPKWIEEYGQQRPDITISHSGMHEYIKEAHTRAELVPLQLVQGELRSGYRAYLLGDTLSTRMPLKLKQRKAEVLVENHLEPLLSLLSCQNEFDYPHEKLRYLWKLLLQNLPHDSICGCGSDEIHQEMMLRYNQIFEIGKHLYNGIQAILSSRPTDQNANGELAVFSPTLIKQKALVRVSLQKVLYPLRYVDYEQDQKLLEFEGNDDFVQPSEIQFIDEGGRHIIGSVDAFRTEDTLECNLMTQPIMNRVTAFECSFVDVFEPMSIKKYRYHFLYNQEKQSAESLENEFFVLEAKPDGTISLFNKQTNRWYHGLSKLVDVADTGDEYTFNGLMDDQELSLDPQSICIKHEKNSIQISGRLLLPKQCAPDRNSRSDSTVECEVQIKASLIRGLPRVDFSVMVDNNARDHRLMALFPLGSRADEVLCDTIYAVENHSIVRNIDHQAYQGWMEQPNNSFFIKNFAALRAKGHGLAVFVKGLPQCEVKTTEEDDQLQLTLLRCVGWLSRKDLHIRNGNGGWSISTPEAQLVGHHMFEFSLFPFAMETSASLYAQATSYSIGTIAIQTSRKGAGNLSGWPSLLKISDSRLVLSAFKLAEDRRGYILRMVNMSQETVSTTLRLGLLASVWQTDLAEKDKEYLGESLVEVVIEVLPWQISTLRLLFSNELS